MKARRRLQASLRSGARGDGRANSGEPLLNVVTVNKLKVLTSLDQKVRGRYRSF